MPSWTAVVARIIVSALTNFEGIEKAVADEVNAIAHGEGGVQKITNALVKLEAIIAALAGVTSQSQQPPAS